jgi:hypothetical protein
MRPVLVDRPNRLNPGCYQKKRLDASSQGQHGTSKAPSSWVARVWTGHGSSAGVFQSAGSPTCCLAKISVLVELTYGTESFLRAIPEYKSQSGIYVLVLDAVRIVAMPIKIILAQSFA